MKYTAHFSISVFSVLKSRNCNGLHTHYSSISAECQHHGISLVFRILCAVYGHLSFITLFFFHYSAKAAISIEPFCTERLLFRSCLSHPQSTAAKLRCVPLI